MKKDSQVSHLSRQTPGKTAASIFPDAAADIQRSFKLLKENVSRVIIGKDDVIELVLVALISRGHVLLEDIPGVGKTTMAKSIAKSIKATFSRIQFTPDLLPSDITGSMIYSPRKEEFFWSPGPLFANILLADEINRTSPRTQSALLEAMEENQVTVDRVSHPLPAPFFVIATQNPYEIHGTFPLPENQTDRFLLSLAIGLPDADSEQQLVRSRLLANPLESLGPVADARTISMLQAAVRRIQVAENVLGYALGIIAATRNHAAVQQGASPRAAVALARTCQGLALAGGRDFVIPDDVQRAAVPVLAHRIIPKRTQSPGSADAARIIMDIVGSHRVPV
ncbi:MAG: MoxR family ATPase [Actinobacteria bacterium]|nr:MoxR family ATPase [Actinomycetota bacterium]